MLQIIVVAAFAGDTALAAPHTVALAGKDTDSVVRLLDMSLAEGQAVDILPGRVGRAVVVADNIVEFVVATDNTAVAVVASCQRRP